MVFMDLGDFQLVSSSPEILARVEDRVITNRPLAGTPPGATAEQDEALERELLADPKEIAEHLMLIDLGRNDVGRVAEIGSVTLTEQMVVERYSHVMHISSNVQGRLRAEFSALDVLRATLPVGTLSGAPKIRAMEIIDELEPTRRGVYGGALGYIAWNGNMDTAIAIRTAVLKDDTLFIQAGGGIVADSIPENEWQESLNKGRAMFRAGSPGRPGPSPRRRGGKRMILLIDNRLLHYNVYQYLGELGADVSVIAMTRSRWRKSNALLQKRSWFRPGPARPTRPAFP